MNTNTTPTGETGAAVRADSEITEAPRAVQTSCGWDAAPVDPDPLIAIRDRMNARLSGGEPVNIVRVALIWRVV